MKKKSITRWIVLCFTCILILSLGLSAVLNYYESYQQTINLGAQWSESCARIVWYLLDDLDLDTIGSGENRELYTKTRELIQTMCRYFRLDYLYIFSINPVEKYRQYIFTSAADPEMDKRLAETRGYGTRSTEALKPEEEAILNGATEMQQTIFKNSYGNEVTWLMPYLDENGTTRAVIAMDYNLESGQKRILNGFLMDIVPMAVALLAGLLFLLLLIRRRIIRPIRVISDSMNGFARDRSKKPLPLNIRSLDEIGEIVDSYEKMTDDISDYVNNIESLTKERLETNVQLDVARRIQYGLVPEKFDLDGSGFHAGALTQPAKAVGGDFYDCFQREDQRVCVVMGDVSGKGISAAIFMAMAKTMIREKLMAGLSPAEALNQANDGLCIQNPEGLFATVFAAALNPATGEVCYANAGHTCPVLLGKTPAVLQPDSGIALGIFEDAGLKDYTLRLAPSEGILLYTDGVTEAVNPQNEFFGMDRLMEAVRALPSGMDPGKTVLRVGQAVSRFTDGNEPFDDMAILALCRAAPETGERALPIDLSSFDGIRKDVFFLAGDTPQTRQALLACDEALTNIVQYSGAEKLFYRCGIAENGLRVVFRDDGKPFDPVAYRSEEKDFEDLDTGGMGVNLIRQSVSSIHYERRDGFNELTMDFSL